MIWWNEKLSTLEPWVGPVYLVIFCCWAGPVPYLELFWAGPVKKITLYISNPSKVEYPQDKKHETTEKIYTYFFPATYGKICVILSSATSKKVEKT